MIDGARESPDLSATFVMISHDERQGKVGEGVREEADKKFKPRANLIALHAADCKWQCRGCHLLLAATSSFNLMSSKMEFHFILDRIR